MSQTGGLKSEAPKRKRQIDAQTGLDGSCSCLPVDADVNSETRQIQDGQAVGVFNSFEAPDDKTRTECGAIVDEKAISEQPAPVSLSTCGQMEHQRYFMRGFQFDTRRWTAGRHGHA